MPALRVNLKLMLRCGLLFTALAALSLVLAEVAPDSVLSKAWVDKHVRGHGVDGQFLFVALTALCVVLGMPRQILCFLGGYALGCWVGAALALAGTLCGSVVAYFVARVLIPSAWCTRWAQTTEQIHALLRTHPFRMALLLRLLPVGNTLITNLAAGLFRTPALHFFAGSTLGFIPQTLIFTLLGSGVALDTPIHIVIGVALFVLCGALGLHLWRRPPCSKTPADSIHLGPTP